MLRINGNVIYCICEVLFLGSCDRLMVFLQSGISTTKVRPSINLLITGMVVVHVGMLSRLPKEE